MRNSILLKAATQKTSIKCTLVDNKIIKVYNNCSIKLRHELPTVINVYYDKDLENTVVLR